MKNFGFSRFIGGLTIPVRSTVGQTPAEGEVNLYVRADGAAYTVNSAGVEQALVPEPAPLHANPSFEIADGSVPASWDFFWKTGTSVVTRDGTQTAFGTGVSMKVALSGTSTQRSFTSLINVTPGSIITVSAWVRSDPGAIAAIGIFTRPSGVPSPLDGSSTIQGSGNLTPSATWQKIKRSWVIPAGHYTCRVELMSESPDGTARTVWWDDTGSSMQIQQASQVLTGSIHMWPTATAPDGYLVADGTEKSVATYPALDTLLGTTYGSRTNGAGAAGSTHFRLPDFNGRSPVGVGTAIGGGVTGATAHTLAQKAGVETHVLTSAELANHTHGTAGPAWLTGTSGTRTDLNFGTGQWASDQPTLGVVGSNGQPHPNMHPFLGINFIIKT